MKRLLFCFQAALALLVSAHGQSIFDQRGLVYTNPPAIGGVNKLYSGPLPVGVGDAQTGNAQPTAKQFTGGIVYGGVTRQHATALVTGANFAENADALDWPRSKNEGGQVVTVMRAAVGAPFLSHGFDFLFGQVIPVPVTDLAGVELPFGTTDYWHPEPVFIKNSVPPPGAPSYSLDPTHTGADYYWSPHAAQAYATKAGQVKITWRLSRSTITALPAGGVAFETHVQIGPFFYAITNTTVLVSGVPVQTPRKMYWTKGEYEKTGKPILIPTGVKAVNFVYNNSIPEFVPENEVVLGGSVVPNTGGTDFNNGNARLFTSTIKAESGFITAYNKEGRIFMELLGDSTGPNTKRQLGVEILQVQRDAIPNDVTIELGERVSAFPGNNPSDASLQPSPITQLGQSFAYRRTLNANGDIELYATRETIQLTDFQVHWMEEGVAGLRWPFRFVRYAFVWPENLAAYSHYVRPVVSSEAAARLTAISLPGENAPRLEYQDPSNLDTPRAKLTEDLQFYTYLDSSQPTLRSLIRYNVGDRVGFERVFSWLDTNLHDRTRNKTTEGEWRLIARQGPGGSAGEIDSWAVLIDFQETESGTVFNLEYPGTGFAIPEVGEAYGTSDVILEGQGKVLNVRVRIDGFTHPNPQTLTLALRNQSGVEINLMEAAGGNASATDLTLTFDDAAGAPIGDSLATGSYVPGGGSIDSMLLPLPGTALANDLVEPRVVSAVAEVGKRIPPPNRELGDGDLYIGGYINRQYGDSYSLTAYADPFVRGFAAAGQSAIIPVNAIPGSDRLEVWWFRKNSATTLRTEALGFRPTYWPSVIGRYQLAWPDTDAPNSPKIVLASNHGSGPLESLQTAGSLYIQNIKGLPGYNPNEEHAMMQGGRVWALRDDLNITSGDDYTSHPFALLEYKAADGRPSMMAFHVTAETDTIRFDYPINAGTILQAPMPLPLLDKPFPPAAPGELPRSLNAEVARRDLLSLTLGAAGTDIDVSAVVSDRPLFQPYQTLLLQNRVDETLRYWLFPTNVNLAANSLDGVVSAGIPLAIEAAATQPASTQRVRYTVSGPVGAVLVGDKVLVANADAGKSWYKEVAAISANAGQLTEVEVDFGAGVDAQADEDMPGATSLVPRPIAKTAIDAANPSGFASGWQVAYELLAEVAAGATDEEVRRSAFYNQITFQDRKGDIWIYRGPHSADDAAARSFQFYYKTLPGFWFPMDKDGNVLGLEDQPPVGTITPYLRGLETDDPIFGADEDGEASGTARAIVYRAHWPESTPVLLMAETLTVPKRGLPAIRGQTSMEILYQQSVYAGDGESVVLHDPTVAKKFQMFDTNPDGSPDGGLNKLPSSLQKSEYRGKTYFPRLAPHLVERFYFDPNDSANGSLIFIGEFKAEALGESYILPNYIGGNDIAALKALCDAGDPQKQDWDDAIDNNVSRRRLTAELETFYPNPAQPGTFTSTIEIGGQLVRQAVQVHAGDLAQVKHSDTAVDSYALTSTGPGVGYVSLIAGQGLKATPNEEPVSVKIIKVVDTLYRGEVKVILSSNPLAEKVTMQQIVDLAGKVDDFDFEWWIGAPTDGQPPAVYGNTPQNLMLSSSGNSWSHLPYPLPGETGALLGGVGVLNGSARLASDVSSVVAPVSGISISSVEFAAGNLVFVASADAAGRLVAGNKLMARDSSGIEFPVRVVSVTAGADESTRRVAVQGDGPNGIPMPLPGLSLYERVLENQPQSILFKEFSVPHANTYSAYYLSLDLDDALGAKVYVDGALVAIANMEDETSTTTAPSGFSPAPLRKVYSLSPQTFAGGAISGADAIHRITVELFSTALPATAIRFACQVDAYESEDKVEGAGSQWLRMDEARFPDKVRTILGEGADVRALSDNYVIMRYKAKDTASYPEASKEWSQWTDPALAEGWIKRVLAGINPFNQRTEDLFNNTVNTDANILTSAGKRWEGDVALNLDSINDYGLIEIYETVLRRGKDLSINAGISYDPANDALLLAAGYLNDLYTMLGNEARSDASNPTIGIGTKDSTYGEIATALYSFKGQLPSLLEEELAMLRGRDDFLQPGVRVAPVYNRLIWNYTRGIDSGEVIYVLNYNILDQNDDGRVDAEDAAHLYPQGHGDAYGHYLTGLKGYYSLLIDKDFAWVPRIEAVNILGKPVAVDYQDERKFAASAAAVARTGRQVFDLTWRRDYTPGEAVGWEQFASTRDNTSKVPPTQRTWGMDHWAARTGQGAYINWAMANSMLPAVDPDPTHEGIQKVDRTTVPELRELSSIGADLQTAMDNAEGRLTPLGLAPGSLAFDINPDQITGANAKPHFEQVYERALGALNNAMASFDDAKDVTRLMRSEQDSLAELQASIMRQEQAYTNALIELYGTPYPDDVGPGKLYKQGYEGPDLLHYRYVETETIEAPGVYTPNEPDYVAKIDIQQLNANWSFLSNPPRADMSTNGPVDGSSSDLVIVNINDPQYEAVDPATGKKLYYIPYAFGSHGFFDKPEEWTSKRKSPGKIQQAISEVIQAHDRMYYALAAQCESDKQDLDKAVQIFKSQLNTFASIRTLQGNITNANYNIASRQKDYEIASKWLDVAIQAIDDGKEFALTAMPDNNIFGLSFGGDIWEPTLGTILLTIAELVKAGMVIGDAIGFTTISVKNFNESMDILSYEQQISEHERQQALKEAVFDLGNRLKAVQGDFQVINEKLRILDDAQRRYASLLAQGERLQQERLIFRQRSAALIQGFRTRDAAFRIFRNEKLERYKSLFDLAARYSYLAANAYDYETGLLNTTKGREFVSRIVNSRALGVMRNGAPQFGGSNNGDPGLSSALAEMRADWDVLRGRLGFNNPSAYGTTFSLRTEKHRIMPGPEGADAWKDVLNRARMANVLEDADVRRYCMQIDNGSGLPIPGLVIEFESTIADGYNFFGQTQQGFDHYFDSSSFATKIFAAGVAFEGYVGMDNPSANAGAVGGAGGQSPEDPSLAFLDPNALGATPGIYLIPVGVDSMRSPALGDTGNIRTWNVEDVTIPLPFNIGGSDFSSRALYQSSESLTEPLFSIRKHASFRPVSTTDAFSTSIYGSSGALLRSQYTNTRLVGRSVWNSKWKLVIPGNKLLHDSDEGVRRFINTVSDVKLHLVTYSYAGN